MSLIFCIFLVGFFWFGMMTMKNKMLQKNATEERKKLQSWHDRNSWYRKLCFLNVAVYVDHQRISKHTMQNHKHSNTDHAQHKMTRKKKTKKVRSFEIGFEKEPLAYASQRWRSLLKSPKIFYNENDKTLLQYWSQNIQQRSSNSSSSIETGVMKKERISFATCFYNFKGCGRKNNQRILLQWKLTNVVAVMNP